MLMKMDGHATDFSYDSPAWTTDNVVNGHDLTEDMGDFSTDSKYWPYNEQKFTEYAARFVGFTWGPANWQVEVDAKTGLEFFTSSETFSGPYAFQEDYFNTKYNFYQTGVGYFATNFVADSQIYYVRWGFTFNNEVNTASVDSVSGIGIKAGKTRYSLSCGTARSWNGVAGNSQTCLLYTSPSPRDRG